MIKFSILLGSLEREEKLTSWLKKYDILWNGGRSIFEYPIIGNKFYSIEFNYSRPQRITFSIDNEYLSIPKYSIINDSIETCLQNIPIITEEMFCEFMDIK